MIHKASLIIANLLKNLRDRLVLLSILIKEKRRGSRRDKRIKRERKRERERNDRSKKMRERD